jgi:hypothetical protein
MAYLVPVDKPLPGPESREAVSSLMATAAGRAFLLYVDRLSASWDNLRADREGALESLR